VSGANARALLRAFERWNASDLDATVAELADDVRWYPGEIFPDFSEVYEGREGVLAFFDSFMEPWEWISVEIVELRELGDQVVVHVRFRAESHEGAGVDINLGQRYRFREGLVARFHGYATFEQALEAGRADA